MRPFTHKFINLIPLMNFKCEKGKIVYHMNMVGSLKCMVNDILSTHAYCVDQRSAVVAYLNWVSMYCTLLVVCPNQIKFHVAACNAACRAAGHGTRHECSVRTMEEPSHLPLVRVNSLHFPVSPSDYSLERTNSNSA